MKKQVKKISKKFLILSLCTSIIFTTCFSHKKIDAQATSVVAGLTAYSLYEICLYFGGLAISALGIGYAYENRDEIAEFGKTVIDSMSTLPEQGWLFGSYASDSSYVYGSEALQEVQDTSWTVIQGGGGSPKNDDDNDGDGDKDADDRTLELDLTGYFLTQAGANFFNNTIKPIYNKWSSGADDDIVNPALGVFNYTDRIYEGYYGANNQWRSWCTQQFTFDVYYDHASKTFDGYFRTEDGYYLGYYYLILNDWSEFHFFLADAPPVFVWYKDLSTGKYKYGIQCYGGNTYKEAESLMNWGVQDWADRQGRLQTNIPVISDPIHLEQYLSNGTIPGVTDQPKYYRVADWIAEDDEWKGHLEDIATSLRSLQDLSSIAQALSDGALASQPSANEYGDMMDNLATQYSPMSNPVQDPVYYPATNTTPHLDPSAFPNYVPDSPPSTGGDTDNPSDSGGEDTPEDIEIDLDGLLSLFNILFYLIMIIIMLIFLFLECLAFIVMIFRIPSSSAMLPEEMVLGFEHLKSIMIPGMNISIYGFSMALIYMFLFFGIIKILRREINGFHLPRSYK